MSDSLLLPALAPTAKSAFNWLATVGWILLGLGIILWVWSLTMDMNAYGFTDEDLMVKLGLAGSGTTLMGWSVVLLAAAGIVAGLGKRVEPKTEAKAAEQESSVQPD